MTASASKSCGFGNAFLCHADVLVLSTPPHAVATAYAYPKQQFNKVALGVGVGFHLIQKIVFLYVWQNSAWVPPLPERNDVLHASVGAGAPEKAM